MATTPDEVTDAPTRERGPAATVPGPRRPVPPRPRRAPVLVAAAATTLWAALVSYAPVFVVVLLAHLGGGAGAQVGSAFKVGLAGWLLAHGVAVRVGGEPLRLVPLAFTLLCAWRVVRAGVHTTRAIGGRRSRSVRVVLTASVAVSLVYGLLGAGAAIVATMPGLAVPVWPAALGLAGFGLVGALAGALIESGVHARVARRTPMPLRDASRTGLVAALLILGAGAGVAGTALALSGGTASKVLGAYHAGVTGQIGLTLACVVYGPDLAVWAASYLVGPGFALGAGTLVSASRVSLGAVPALPVLAAVPTRPVPEWAGLLLAVPLAAGMAAGWLLARRRLRVTSPPPADGEPPPGRPVAGPSVGWTPLLGAALLAGPVAGLVLAAAVWASAGSLGAARLAEVGPRPWPLAEIVAGLVAAGAVAAAAATKVLVGVRRKGA